MNTTTLANIYAAVLHVVAIAAAATLVALGKLDPTTGMAVIAGLVGFTLGLPVQLPGTPAKTVTLNSPVVPLPPAAPADPSTTQAS